MTTNQTPDTTPRTGHTLTLIAGVAVVACLVAAAVALVFRGWKTADILALLTGLGAVAAPLVAAVAKLVNIERETVAQTGTLSKIDHQTNGVLESRMEAAAHRALSRALNDPIGYLPAPTDDGDQDRQ